MTGPGDDDSRDAADDRALLRAAGEGDADAFGHLVARHCDLLWLIAVRLVGDPARAADCLLAGVVAAYRSSPRARGEISVRSWLAGQVVDSCLGPGSDRLDPAATVGDGSPQAGPDGGLPRRTLEAAVLALPADLRAAVVLLDVAGLPADDADRVLRLPPGAAEQRCRRGRARLALAVDRLRNPADPPPVLGDGQTEGTGGAP